MKRVFCYLLIIAMIMAMMPVGLKAEVGPFDDIVFQDDNLNGH